MVLNFRRYKCVRDVLQFNSSEKKRHSIDHSSSNMINLKTNCLRFCKKQMSLVTIIDYEIRTSVQSGQKYKSSPKAGDAPHYCSSIALRADKL